MKRLLKILRDRTKIAKIAGKIFLGFTAFLFASLIMEIGVRIFDPQVVVGKYGAYDFGCFQKGTYYWIDFKSSSQCILKSYIQAFPSVTIKTNKMGLRNREIVMPKPAGTTRILFVGDSYTVGWGVGQDEAFPQVTERLLKEVLPNKNIETINAGLTASGLGYDYLFLKNELKKIDADIVVVGFYLFNDIAENLYYSDWQEIDESGLPLKIDSYTSFVGADGNIYVKEIPFKYTLPVLKNSHLFLKLANWVPQEKTKQFHSKFVSTYLCFYKEACRDLDEEKNKAKMLFSAIKRLTAQNGQKLLVAFIPVEFQIDRNARNKYLEAPLLPRDREYPYQYFSQFFSEAGIDYLDFREQLKVRSASEGPFYYERDDHWNSAGHRVAAEAISRKLVEDYMKDLGVR